MADSTLNRFLARGTAAQRAAFTPSPPTPASGPSSGYVWFETDTGNTYAWDGASWVQVNTTVAGAGVTPPRCEGRLTLESGVPISTTDQIAKSTLYWTPAVDGIAVTTGVVTLWTGSALVDTAVTQQTLTLSGLTSGKNYDVFLDYHSGTPQLVLSAAWASDTARTDALASQYDSTRKATILIKSGTAAYRWLGTIRTTATTTTEDSGGGTTTQVGGKRFVWNAYQQVRRHLRVIDTTDSWSYLTNTIRQANNASGNKVEYVTGDAASFVEAGVLCNVETGNSTTGGKVGVGVDSTTTFAGLVPIGFTNLASAQLVYYGLYAPYDGYPGLGYHYLSWNEKGGGGTTCTFTGDDGGDSSQSGLRAVIWN